MQSLQQSERDCAIKGTAHRMTCDAYTQYSAFLKVPTLLFATLITASSSIFAALNTQERWTQIIVAIFSVMVLALTSIASWLSYGEIALKHGNKAKDYEKLAMISKKYLNGLYEDNELKRKAEKVVDMVTVLVGEMNSPRLPIKFERMARDYLKDHTLNAIQICCSSTEDRLTID